MHSLSEALRARLASLPLPTPRIAKGVPEDLCEALPR